MILVIDNFDSFVHNIARYVREAGATISLAFVLTQGILMATLHQRLMEAVTLGLPTKAGTLGTTKKSGSGVCCWADKA